MVDNISSILLSSIVASSITAFISKLLYEKILDYTVERKIEEYKDKLDYTRTKNISYFTQSVEKEIYHLDHLWKNINEHMDVCGNYSKKEKSNLTSSYKKISKYLYDYEPFLQSELVELTRDLLNLTDPTSYMKNDFNKALISKDKIIKVYRKRLYVK